MRSIRVRSLISSLAFNTSAQPLAPILIVVVALSEPTKKSLVINGFDVPTSLEASGFTSGVLGKKLVDQTGQQTPI